MTHVYPVEEIDYHEESCPGRLLVEMFSLKLTEDPEENDQVEEEGEGGEEVNKSCMSEIVSSAHASIGKDNPFKVVKKGGNKSDEEDWSEVRNCNFEID